jgi:hypothetical protein
MQEVGLKGVGLLPAGMPDIFNLSGYLPGSSGWQVILSAHYDTVPNSPGAIDDASGCGVVLAAASELARTPRRHQIRFILFDQEEAGGRGSRIWLDQTRLSGRESVLANINVDMVGWSEGAPVILSFPMDSADRVVQTPGWLVHTVLQGTSAAGMNLRMLDARWPLMMQMVARNQRFRYGMDSDAFLRQQVPSLTLSDSPLMGFDPLHHSTEDEFDRLDGARLTDWSRALTSVVRRLDTIQSRPIADDQYLVALGRVWPRKHLYWAGFLIWIIMVFKGMPGRWVSTSSAERVGKRSQYLPGFGFRMLFLLSLFVAPAMASVLLYPAGLASVFIGRQGQRSRVARLLGLVPVALLGGFFLAARLKNLTYGWPFAWWSLALILIALTAFAIATYRPFHSA